MKVFLIVADASGYAHAGLDVERTAKTFDMPPEMADYIRMVRKNPYATISFALEENSNEQD